MVKASLLGKPPFLSSFQVEHEKLTAQGFSLSEKAVIFHLHFHFGSIDKAFPALDENWAAIDDDVPCQPHPIRVQILSRYEALEEPLNPPITQTTSALQERAQGQGGERDDKQSYQGFQHGAKLPETCAFPVSS